MLQLDFVFILSNDKLSFLLMFAQLEKKICELRRTTLAQTASNMRATGWAALH